MSCFSHHHINILERMNMSDDCNSAVDRTNQMFLCYIKKQPPRSAVMKTGLYLKAVSTSSPWNSQFGALISCAESKNVSGCCRWEEDGGGRRVFPRRSIASLASCQKYRCVQSFVLFFFSPRFPSFTASAERAGWKVQCEITFPCDIWSRSQEWKPPCPQKEAVNVCVCSP